MIASSIFFAVFFVEVSYLSLFSEKGRLRDGKVEVLRKNGLSKNTGHEKSPLNIRGNIAIRHSINVRTYDS